MRQFLLRIRTGNDAFETRPLAEVARILRKLADTVETMDEPTPLVGPLKDHNGNRVGEWVHHQGGDR